MKTMLDIDPELYAAAERRAHVQHKTVDQVVTELLRHALEGSDTGDDQALAELERRNGIIALPERPGPRVTVEDVQRLCREEGI